MKTEIKDRWVEALRSGKYTQARAVLRTADDKWCCLGVLCDLAEQEGVVTHERPSELHSYRYTGTKEWDVFEFGSTTTLPMAVREWAGLIVNNPSVEVGEGDRSLAGLNDDGADFSEIADLIEEQL